MIPSAPSGTYKLLSVKDKFCPGDVVETEWRVGILTRPKVGLDEKAGKKKGGIIRREGVCQNKVDSVGLTFEGEFETFNSSESRSENDLDSHFCF